MKHGQQVDSIYPCPSALGPPSLRCIAWSLVQMTLFRYSFHNWYGFRRRLLILFGAQLANEVRVRPSVKIDQPWNLSAGKKSSIGDGCIIWAHAPVSLGERSVCSQYTILCTWTIELKYPYNALPAQSITIGDDVWIATECFVEPGSQIPNGVVVGARSVIRNKLTPWTIAAGDPAVSKRTRQYKGR